MQNIAESCFERMADFDFVPQVLQFHPCFAVTVLVMLNQERDVSVLEHVSILGFAY